MVTALQSFDLIQLGEEAEKGTALAATVQMVGTGTLREIIDRYRPEHPRQIRAAVGGGGIDIMKHTELEIAMDLSPEQVLWPLHTGVLGDVTPSDADPDYTYTFTPELDTAAAELDTATIEIVRGDGDTNHLAREYAYGLTSGFDMEWGANVEARMLWRVFARTSQTSTPTAALTPYTGLESLKSNLLSVFVDDDWASLGGSQLNTVVRSAKLSYDTGIVPDYTLDGRSDIDFTIHRVGKLAVTLDLVLEFDAVGAVESFGDYRANNIRFVRLNQAGAANSFINVDLATRFTAEPSESVDGDQRLVALSLEGVYDPTGDEVIEFTVLNQLASL